LLEIVAASHAGMTTSEFTDAVIHWSNVARHPRSGRPYVALSCQPMLEVLALLRTNSVEALDHATAKGLDAQST
jgi:hypothetical protein